MAMVRSRMCSRKIARTSRQLSNLLSVRCESNAFLSLSFPLFLYVVVGGVAAAAAVVVVVYFRFLVRCGSKHTSYSQSVLSTDDENDERGYTHRNENEAYNTDIRHNVSPIFTLAQALRHGPEHVFIVMFFLYTLSIYVCI